MIRTIVEVSGQTAFKAYPKSAAGAADGPATLHGSLPILERAPGDIARSESRGLVFTDSVGKPLRRTLFRIRVWRPSLVHAGLLGEYELVDEHTVRARWVQQQRRSTCPRISSSERGGRPTPRSVKQAGGLVFHGLRHSYATWLVDDGVPVNMVQQVMGHERSSTTLDLYTRRTEGDGRILQGAR